VVELDVSELDWVVSATPVVTISPASSPLVIAAEV
jgi:hypothetical protein